MKTTLILILCAACLLVTGCVAATPTPPAAQLPSTEAPADVPTAAATAEAAATPAAVEGAAQGTLTAQPWQWTAFTSPVEQFDVEAPQSYLLRFDADGTLDIVADCNRATGSYTEEMASSVKMPSLAITITIGPMTIAACPPESRSEQFVTLLGSAARYFFQDGQLFIDLMADGGTLAFAPADPELMADDGEGAVAGALPRFEPLAECFVEPPADLELEADIDCGYVVVPESRAGDSAREIKLGVTRLNSGQGAGAAPLFMLGGGPGGTHITSDYFRLFHPELLGRILASRDVVILEQRGTRFTNTWLDCPAMNAASWKAYEQGLTDDEATALAGMTLQGCIDDFKAQGVNFDAYNSVENAADVNAVREALGYDQIIYYGASYGAQLGQHVLRDFPQILEGVVLDGANALSRKSWVEDQALDAQWGIDNLTALCQADEKCAAAYDIPALVDAALALFDDGPLPYTYTDPADPSLAVDVEVTVNDMVNFIHGQQGDRLSALTLPATLLQLTQGDARQTAEALGAMKASRIVASRNAPPSAMALLMHAAVVCSDDPVKSTDDVVLDGAGAYATLFGQAAAEEYVQLCSVVDVQALPDSTDINVSTDVPVLLLGGNLDVATPTFRSQEVADALPNAKLVVFPGRTHVQIAGVNFCAGQVMTQFVLDPTAELDTSCTETAPLLGFVLPDGSNSKEAE